MRNLAALAILAVLCLAQSGARSGIDTSALDPACKPCDDFWRYATGAWNDKHPIPADRARWGTFDELQEANLERLRTILETASASPGAGDQRRLGDFYASCVDAVSIEAAGAKPIKARLDRIAAIQSRRDLAAALAGMDSEIPVGPAVLGAGSDPDDADRMIAFIRAGGLSLPDRDYYFRDDARSKEIRDEFVNHVERTL
jgi:putative endopeptidase